MHTDTQKNKREQKNTHIKRWRKGKGIPANSRISTDIRRLEMLPKYKQPWIVSQPRDLTSLVLAKSSRTAHTGAPWDRGIYQVIRTQQAGWFYLKTTSGHWKPLTRISYAPLSHAPHLTLSRNPASARARALTCEWECVGPLSKHVRPNLLRNGFFVSRRGQTRGRWNGKQLRWRKWDGWNNVSRGVCARIRGRPGEGIKLLLRVLFMFWDLVLVLCSVVDNIRLANYDVKRVWWFFFHGR